MKLVKVNMTNKSVAIQDVGTEYADLGGRGLTSIMINREVPPTCDPLGPQNKLIFAIGYMTGTRLVNTSRISIGAKSPLTGGIKESNAGGTVGAALGKLGIKAIIVEGQAPDGNLSILRITKDGEASLIDAQAFKGIRTYALVEMLLDTYGKKTSVLCIGPAGEYQLVSASVQSSDVDGRPSRAAGRGGLGAVMGSKGLKAIVVDQGGKNTDVISDPGAFKKAARAFTEAVREHPNSGQVLPALGTASLIAPINSLGAFPCYNATEGTFEGWKKITGEVLAEIIKKRGGNPTHTGCSQCIIRCSNEFVDKHGKFVTSALEYETIWAMGGMTGIDDLDTIARLDFLCDDIGVDTMNTGVAIAVAMDSGYRPFGDKQAAINMLEEIAKGTNFGRILGNGPAAVGKHFNHPRVPVVKNQSIAAYDPRGMQGNGVTYATSPMGADHTAGNLVGIYLGGKLDPLTAEGQMEASRNAQVNMAFIDSTGLCLFASSCLRTPKGKDAFLKALTARLGKSMGDEDMNNVGILILQAEREFNRKAGLTEKDDRLPKFFYEEPLPPHNKVFLLSEQELDRTLDF
jgi:aldehyde:ferredoxin oxidoreductase